MAKSKKEKEKIVTIDGIDYNFDDMNDEAKMLVNHVGDLDNKLAHSRFNLDQLSIGREACMEKLNEALGHEAPEVEAEIAG